MLEETSRTPDSMDLGFGLLVCNYDLLRGFYDKSISIIFISLLYFSEYGFLPID